MVIQKIKKPLDKLKFPAINQSHTVPLCLARLQTA